MSAHDRLRYKLFITHAVADIVSASIMSSCPASFRGTNLKHARDHVPIIPAPSLSKPKSDATVDITGPRNPELVARRNQTRLHNDAEVYVQAFGGGPPKLGTFHTAAQKQIDKERRAHMLQQESQQESKQNISRLRNTKVCQANVEFHLTPEPSKSNGLLARSAESKLTPSEHARLANEKNGGLNWLRGIPFIDDSKPVTPTPPAKRSFSEARTMSTANLKPKLSTELTNPNCVASSKLTFSASTRDALYEVNPQFHPARNHLKDTSNGGNTHCHPSAIPSERFYSANGNSNRSTPLGARSSATSPHPLSSCSATDASTPEPSHLQRTTRSQATLAKRCLGSVSTPAEQSIVIIDSDDDGGGFQSPKYTSPKTNSEKKCVSDRMIPQNIVQSFRSICGKDWMFAYPVKDCRGIISNENHSQKEAGDHCAILPYNKGSTVAYLFFTSNGDVIIVPEDGQRNYSLPRRNPQKFSLLDCASVITTLNTEEKTDTKNEFQLIFSLKPHATFTPLFDADSKSQTGQQEDDDSVVLVDDAASADDRPHASVAFEACSTMGDTLRFQDPDSSVINVDDAKSYSSIGFKLQNPVFVDGRPSLKELEFTHNVKRFNEFIWKHIQSQADSRAGRVMNATSAYTHVTIGIPRSKPSNIVEDPTELLDYQVPEPEKTCSAALDACGAPPARSKKSSVVHRVISVGDFARLDKGECLSDATIDFYSSWLRQTYPVKCRGIYFASSFFFKKLWSQQKDSKGQTDFSYMQKWNSIDIFTFDKVMFPVNLNYHWSLIVLENPAALLSQQKGCRLLYFDSLLTWDINVSELFFQWICWMHMRKTDPQGELKPLLISRFSLEGKKQVLLSSNSAILRAQTNNWLQENTYDCGVFVLRYMEVRPLLKVHAILASMQAILFVVYNLCCRELLWSFLLDSRLCVEILQPFKSDRFRAPCFYL